jgi:hypothetical protein
LQKYSRYWCCIGRQYVVEVFVINRVIGPNRICKRCIEMQIFNKYTTDAVLGLPLVIFKGHQNT